MYLMYRPNPVTSFSYLILRVGWNSDTFNRHTLLPTHSFITHCTALDCCNLPLHQPRMPAAGRHKYCPIGDIVIGGGGGGGWVVKWSNVLSYFYYFDRGVCHSMKSRTLALKSLSEISDLKSLEVV